MSSLLDCVSPKALRVKRRGKDGRTPASKTGNQDEASSSSDGEAYTPTPKKSQSLRPTDTQGTPKKTPPSPSKTTLQTSSSLGSKKPALVTKVSLIDSKQSSDSKSTEPALKNDKKMGELDSVIEANLSRSSDTSDSKQGTFQVGDNRDTTGDNRENRDKCTPNNNNNSVRVLEGNTDGNKLSLLKTDLQSRPTSGQDGKNQAEQCQYKVEPSKEQYTKSEYLTEVFTGVSLTTATRISEPVQQRDLRFNGSQHSLSSQNKCDQSLELLGKSSQETHKLDLMVEISQLQHSLTAAERDRKEMRDSLTTAEKRINDLQSRLNERTIEVTELRNRLARVENGGVPYTSSLERSDTEIEGLKKAVEALMMSNKEKDKQIDDLKKLFRRYRRIDELIFNAQRDGRKSLDLLEFPDNVSDSSSTQLSATSSSLSADPALRDPHTPDSIDALERYTRPNMPYPSATSTPVTMQQSAGAARVNGFGSHVDASPLSVISHQGNLGARANSAEDLQQTLMQTPPTVTRKGQSFGTLPRDITGPILPLPSRGDPSNMHSLPPISPRKPFNLSQPLSRHNVTNNYRYPTNSESDTRDMVDNADTYSARSYEAAMSLTRPVHHSNTMPRCFGSGGAAKSASTQAIPNMASHHMSSASGSQSAVGDLDPQQRQQQQQQLQPPLRKQRGFRSFGKGFFKMRPGRWSNSAPNLAQTEQDEEALKDRMAQEYKQIQAHNNDAQQKQVKKNKSIKKTFFGKLKRSNSQELDEQLGDFRRGGVRATASGRIGSGWTGGQQFDLEVPFSRWDSDHVSTWLHGIGLSMYVGSCKRWVRHGEQLLSASNSDLEKELHIKNPLHRKKLQLALKTISEGSINSGEHIHRLDHNWVTRWLDDIGLPQYKDAFYDGMVDGRMLHSLAVDDLVYLKVTSTLHHYSIRAGIQVLRLHHFNPTCLRRRPLPEEPSAQGKPNEVMLWTNHRVMEWLRSIDLSEYAPNLRGSGVHGGLMVLENQFTAELLASMLNIPANKTLLRRHLSTHFVALIGSDTQQRKRETEQAPSYTPLTPAMKIKVKKGIFGHRRTRSMSEDDYLCPLDTPVALAAAETRSNGSGPPSCNGTLERERRGGAFA